MNARVSNTVTLSSNAFSAAVDDDLHFAYLKRKDEENFSIKIESKLIGFLLSLETFTKSLIFFRSLFLELENEG